MDKVVNKTFNVLARFGERIERRINGDDSDDESYTVRAGSPNQFRSSSSRQDSFFKDGLKFSQRRRNSADHIAGNPSYSSFRNYRQNQFPNPMMDRLERPQYGTGIGTTMTYPPIINNSSSFTPAYPSLDNNSFNSFGQNQMSYGSSPSANAAYAPEYYIAERRQIDLVPVPRPQVIQQQVPVPFPVDRPVPVPVPVPVPTPVAVDRPVPYAVPVPVPAPSPPPMSMMPMCTPVSVQCFVPVGIPVPSPPPSPVMFENSVTHTQRWYTGSSGIAANPYTVQVNRSFM